MKKKRRTKTKSRIKKARKRQMSAVSIQRLRTLAGQIGEVIPATSFGKGGFCFATIAKKMGLQKHWSSGTKKEAIFGLLKPLYRDHPKMFYRLFRENIARGIERRHKLGNPVLEPEILALDRTLRDLDVNLSREFKALNLPKERPRIVPPPAGFQKMVDELGLHPFLQPDCAKLFKDGHINESVRKALEKYEVYIQKKAGITKIGANLMAHAFSESNPLVPVADVNQPRGKGLQEGFKFLSMGAMEFWRNFCSHGDEKQVPHQDAIAIIAVVSHLLVYVDQSTSPPLPVIQ